MATLLIIGIVFFLLWPTIKKWMTRYMAHKTEDFIRNATGMPPRDKSRGGKSAASSGASYSRGSSGSGGRRKRRDDSSPIIPREYAEDVEFVETIDYSETVIREDLSDGTRRVYAESQVSDVEYVEIKSGKTPPPPRR